MRRPKMLTHAHKRQRLASTFFLELYRKGGCGFLNHSAQVTSIGTGGCFVDVESKEKSKEWMHTSTRQADEVRTNISVRQEGDGNRYMEEKTSSDGGSHAIMGHNNFRSLFRNIKKLDVAGY
jgi:hypothetical protein